MCAAYDVHQVNSHAKTHPSGGDHEGDGWGRVGGGGGGWGQGGVGVGEKWVNVGLNQLIYLGI